MEGSSSTAPAVQQLYRSAFHFQPPENWMNDPNGPFFYKGIYHFFYQYNPNGATFDEGVFSWGHSISHNLVDWVHLQHALNPTHPFDINGCWSGSVTLLDGKPAILYTGIDSNKQEVQNLAFAKDASDPYLREWIKSDQNPLMIPVDDIGKRLFRDPTTAWKGRDGKWRVLIGGEIGGNGTALLYESDDFVKWTRAENPLHFSDKTSMWECPDFYPVSVNDTNGLDTSVLDNPVKCVLKASFHGNDYYVIGTYESETNDFSVDVDFMDKNVDLRFDYGKYYASKSFYDSGRKRRISWAWIPEANIISGEGKKGWSGLQSFPRSIWLDQGRERLLQWPVTEIERLRRNEVSFQNKEIKGGAVIEITGITASQADIEVSFSLPNLDDVELLDPECRDPQVLCQNALVGGKFGPFGLFVLASDKLTELTAIFFRVYNDNGKLVVLMCSDQRRSSLSEDVEKSVYGVFVDVVDPAQKISLRTLIDHSIVESFGGEGKACITARVYPQLAVSNDARLHVFNYGTETMAISNFSGWSMDSAQFTTDV